MKAHKLNIEKDNKKPSKISDLLYKADVWINRIGWWRVRYFFRSVKNLIRWAPVIWKDRDWDHRYIYDILKFKIQNQAKYIGQRDIHTRAKRDAKIMMTCVRLIEKVSDEFYDEEYMDFQKSEFHFIPCKDKEDLFELEIEEKSNRYNEYFAKYPRQYKAALNKTDWPYTVKTDRTIAMWIGDQNQKRAQDLLFRLINENIRGWWD